MAKWLIITIAFVTIFSISARSQDIAIADSVYTTVDVQPEFPGGYKAKDNPICCLLDDDKTLTITWADLTD